MTITKKQALTAAINSQPENTAKADIDFLQALDVCRELAEEKARIYWAASRWVEAGTMPDHPEIRRDARKREALLLVAEKITELKQLLKQQQQK